MYDAIPLSGQIVLIEPDAEKPATLSYGEPTRKPDFEANMVRESGSNSFWRSLRRTGRKGTSRSCWTWCPRANWC